MSFQAYIDTIKTKTGKNPDYFLTIAREKGLLTPTIQTGKIIEWLAKDFDLGRGHAMALVVTFKDTTLPKESYDQQITNHFTGSKATWRKSYDQLIAKVNTFGDDVSVWPGGSYLSLLRNGKKFAIIQVTGNRLDIGIKRKGTPPTETFKAAGAWNSMVTHRIQITDPEQIGKEVIDWLHAAYKVA